MKHTNKSRILSLLLVLAMVFSMLPVNVFAAGGTATWSKVDLADITAEDTVAITMTNASGVTYVLPSNETSKNSAPVVTVEGEALTTGEAANYSWTITPVDGGYTISVNGAYLYTTDANNGVNVGEIQAVWTLDGNYLSASDGTNTRWLGVYDNNNGAAVASPNWRAYKNTTGNTKNQVVSFWKLEETSEEPTEPTDAPEIAGDSFELVSEVSEGDQVLLYNAGSGTVLTSTASGYKLAAESLTPAENVITTESDTAVWTVGVDGDGNYTFTQGDMALGVVQSGTYVNLSTNAADGYTAWTLESSATEGVFYLKNVNMPASSYGPYYLEYYSGYTAYASNSPSDGQYGISFYKLVEEGDEDPTDPPEPEVALPFANGDQVVIYAPAYDKALSATKDNNYHIGVDVAVNDGVLSGYGETEIWNVIVQDDGSVSFSNLGLNIGMSEGFNGLSLGFEADRWTLTELGNGLYNVQNVVRGNYMEWYAKYSNWSTYNSSSAATDDQFQLAFYVVPEGVNPEPTEPTDPDPSEPDEPEAVLVPYMAEAPGNGDTVLIYNAANTAVMGSAASGSRMAGVTAEASEGAIALTEDMAQLLVTVENDQYIFSLNGQYLTSALGGNGLSFSNELTDCGKWTLEQQADGTWIIMNVGANYNGNYNQAMEYYNGFTTYGVKTDNVAYKFNFYLVKEAENEAPMEGTGKLTAADQLTNGTYTMMLSTGYAPGVLDGTWITAVQPTVAGDQVTNTAGGVWTLTVDGTSVKIADSNGAYIGPKGGNNNGLSSTYSAADAYSWSWTFDETSGTFSFWGVGDDTVVLASNTDPQYANKFRAYKTTTVANYPDSYPSAFTLYKVDTTVLPDEDTKPEAGAEVVIYNLSAQGVLAAENDTQSIENALAEIVEGFAVPENGGVVFTVEIVDGYYRFYNETYGYLCSNGTGNNAFYSKEASEDADWTLLAGKSGGWNLESRTAKYNGTYSQYLEYYADSYKTYSMYNVTDYDIYEFVFYPVAEDINLTGGIVNAPDVVFGNNGAAYLGMDYTYTFSVDAIFGVETLTVSVGGVESEYTYDEVLGVYTVIVTAEKIQEIVNSDMPVISISISGVDNTGMQFSNGSAIDIIDEPSIGVVTPAANAETGEDKRPVISAEITNAGAEPSIVMTVNGEEVEAVYENGVIAYTPAEDLADGRTTVSVTVTRADGKKTSKTWSFTVGEAQYALYFGQLHSHTTYSDGSGSLESALDYIASLPESANVDFVAFTDHSNYFDASGAANVEGALYDMSLATAASQTSWNAYKTAIAEFNAENNDVIAIGGFEMTWSGGPGHINTFATPGIVSRNNTTLNNKTSDAGMKAYYALLSQAEGVDSISQFNHPGTTFGNFTDFAYWDALIDSRIQLVEVGNGEGQIGAGGYYPSYEQYTLALDKGWHVAPTNNQDNHKGKWGNANDARDVILTDDFSEEGIYAAIRAMRMYATEDKNLEIGYSVNDQLLGSTISEVPEKLNIAVTVYDPDVSDSISKVEVIVNSGKVAHTWSDPADLADGALSVELSPDYSYYYIRVTEGDGDIAVTAPVWVGEMLKLGISSVECGTSTPVTGEELEITTTLFNSETTDATVKSLTYTVGSQVLSVDNTGYTIPASSNVAVNFKYTPDVAKIMKVTVTAVVVLDGTEYTFSMDVELDVQDADKLVYIGIDASHYNEYVAGNYKDSMGNFSQLAAGYSVRTVELKTSEDLIAACENDKYVALILTAPSRRLAAAQSDPKVYSAEELAAIAAFNKAGGTVILAGWSDNYENYDVIQNNAAIMHMAATQNAVLEALGSSLRIGDDATYDDVRSAADGVDKWRLYFNTYGDSFLTEGVEVDPEHPYDRMYTEVFSHYGGATVYTVDGTLPATVNPVVFGHASTYSVDVDGDGLGGDDIPKYTYAEGDDRLMVMASEQLEGQGLIIVSGAAFMSNFEVQATIEDSGSEKNYSNYRICENLVSYLNPVTVTDIAEVRAQTEVGYKYTIEGVVTSNASGYDKDTAFFDCIYVRDETAGICCFPVAGNYKIGDLVRITGTTEYYQGEPELQVTSIEVIGEAEVKAEAVTAAQINDRSAEGKLVTLEGVVESFELANGLVQTILVKDTEGNVARVFIDGYITTAEDVQELAVGNAITVTGLASYDDTFNAPEGPFPRIRVRDRADVVCVFTGHNHDKNTLEYHEAVEATCHQNGMQAYYYCAECDAFFDTDLVQTNSKRLTIVATVGLTYVEAKPACHVPGIAEYWYCAECQAVFADAAGTILTNRQNLEIPADCELAYVPAAKACHAPGSAEYWYCPECDAVYADAAGTILTNRKNLETPATVKAEHVAAKAAGCHDLGNVEYWYCAECESYFTDEALTQITNAKNVILPELGSEKIEHYEAVAATCHDRGNVEYWHCPECDRYFLDEAATQLTNALSIYLPELGSEKVKHVEAAASTCETEGNVEYWYCEECDRYFLDEACTLLSNALSVKLPKIEECSAQIFSDIQIEAWYHEAVDYVANAGIMNGMPDGTFAPDGATTRAQLAVMLWRLAGAPTGNADTKFTDLDPDAEWYQEAIKWAFANGVVNGRSETTFAPDANVTRQEMVTMFYRFAKLMKVDLSAKGDLSKFSDGKDVADWANEAMTWAVGSGMIEGNSINGVVSLDLNSNATRAQMATVMMRYIEDIAK